MTRLLTLLAVAAVAGAMYVAAAPGGLRSSGPTAAQFRALKTKVTQLQKTVGQVRKLSVAEGVVLADCLMHQAQAVDRLGTPGSSGYLYGNAAASSPATALDLAPSGETSSQFYFLAVNPACAPTINSTSTASKSSSLRHLFALAEAQH
jgi:hypothetical protein